MQISAIIQQVMLAIDEEYVTSGVHAGTHLSKGVIDNIRSAALQTLRWLALYAPVETLDGSDETDMPGFLQSPQLTVTNGAVTLPFEFVRLARVRLPGWHRAVSETIPDTSEAYLALSDETATATIDRPVAAIVYSNPKKLELWPASEGTLEIDIVCQPQLSIQRLKTGVGETAVPIPPKAAMGFIYHTAFLSLLSYRDSSANMFREVALNALGINNK